MLMINVKSTLVKITAILIIASFNSMSYSISRSALVNKINRIYKETFERKKLLENSFNFLEWPETASQVQNFVKENAKDNQELIKYSNSAIYLNNSLISNIKATFKDINNPDTMKDSIKLSSEIKKLAGDLKKLKVKTGMVFSSSQGDAKAVLETFVAKLEDLANKRKTEYENKISKSKEAHLKTEIEMAFKDTFEKRNIFDQRLDVTKWNGVLDKARTYLLEASKNDKTLNSFVEWALVAFKKTKPSINENLINNIKLMYNLTFGATKPEYIDLKAAEKLHENNKVLLKDATALQKRLFTEYNPKADTLQASKLLSETIAPLLLKLAIKTEYDFMLKTQEKFPVKIETAKKEAITTSKEAET